MLACTINALQGNVPAIKLVLGVAILTHHTLFLANNFSTAIARYSLEWPVNLLSPSWFVSELSCQRVDCQQVGLSVSCLVSELTVSKLVCQRDVCEAMLMVMVPQCPQTRSKVPPPSALRTGKGSAITGTNPYCWTLTDPRGGIILNKC